MPSRVWWYINIIFLYQAYIVSSTTIYSSLYWSPLNPIFKKNASKNVLQGSRIYIVCPNTVLVPADIKKPLHVEDMFENVWIVDKKGYNTCTVNKTNPNHKHWLDCNTTTKLRHRNIVFVSWGPVDQGYEFYPQKEYYVIATSNGSKASLNNLAGGRCSTHNMRMSFYVCGNQDPKCIERQKSTRDSSEPVSKFKPSTPTSSPVPRKSKKNKKRFQGRLGANKIKRLINRTRLLPKIKSNSEKINDILKLLKEMNRKIDSIQELTVEQSGRNCTWIKGRGGDVKRLKCKKLRHIKSKKHRKCKKHKRNKKRRRS